MNPKSTKFVLSNMSFSVGGKSDIEIKSPLQILTWDSLYFIEANTIRIPH